MSFDRERHTCTITWQVEQAREPSHAPAAQIKPVTDPAAGPRQRLERYRHSLERILQGLYVL